MFCTTPELLGLHDCEVPYFYPQLSGPRLPPADRTDLTIAHPEFWFAAVFIAAHSLQWRAHEHYHAMQYLDRHGIGDPEGAMLILAGQRLGVLRSIHHLAAVSRDTYAIVAGTMPFMDCSRPRNPPFHLGSKLRSFWPRGYFPDPMPSTFPISIPPRLVHVAGGDYPYRPHPRALYAYARFLTMSEAWRRHLTPATYPVQWSLWEQCPWSHQIPIVAHLRYHRRASCALLDIPTGAWTRWYFRRAFPSSRHSPTMFPTQVGFNRALTEGADDEPAEEEGTEGHVDDSADADPILDPGSSSASSWDPRAASSADRFL